MTLRARLAAAFFVVVVGPAMLGAVVLASLVTASGSSAVQVRLDHGARAVRTTIAAECDRLAAGAQALAIQASMRGRSVARPPTAPQPTAPQPWAFCGEEPPYTRVMQPGSQAEPAALTRYGALAARAEVRDSAGIPLGYVYSAVPLDDAFLARLSAAAGVRVAVAPPKPPVEADESLVIEPDAGQPLRLAITVAAAEPRGRYPVVLALVLTAVVVAGAFAWWLSRLATRPLDDLVGAVDRVMAGDVNARSGVRGRDELGRLGGAVNRLIVELHQVQQLSVTDALTGLWNVRHLGESLRLEVERANRFGRSLGVLAMDLDRFKDINDRYGHRAGDAVLAEFAQRIRGVVREVDLAFRQGGEEFVILLPETDVAGCATAARRVGAAIRGSPFTVAVAKRDIPEDTAGVRTPRARELDLLEVPITVSIGIAVFPHHASTDAEVLDAADEALYAAKAAGRDTFVLAASRLPTQRVPAGLAGAGLGDTGGASGGTAPPPATYDGSLGACRRTQPHRHEL